MKEDKNKNYRNELFNKASHFAVTQQLDEFLSTINKLLDINGNDTEALQKKGNFLDSIAMLCREDGLENISAKHFEEAKLCYEKIYRIDPNNVINLIDLGDHYRFSEEYENSVNFYTSVIEFLKNDRLNGSKNEALESAYEGKIESLECLGLTADAKNCKLEAKRYCPDSENFS
jgi:tetratricopeptide (TPR) repeat protein